MTYVRVPKYAKDLRLGDIMAGCPEGCQCTGFGHAVRCLTVDSTGLGRAVVTWGNSANFPPSEFKLRDIVITLVDVERITPMRLHAQRITASDLRSRGWFRWYAKHHVACSCGWQVNEPVTGGSGYARQLWLEHKAEEVSALLAPKYSYLSSSLAVLVGLDPEDEWHRRFRVVFRNRGGVR
jgi:hypothetical protein